MDGSFLNVPGGTLTEEEQYCILWILERVSIFHTSNAT